MIAASETKTIKVEVSNFGPIAEANVELRPMSIFVGPSNTGKSYLATLIYALHQFFGAFSGLAHNRETLGYLYSRRMAFVTPVADMTLSVTDIDELYAWAETERRRIDATVQTGASPPDSELSVEVSEMIRRALIEVQTLNDVLNREIVRCFGVDTSASLIRYSDDNVALRSIRTVVSNELAEGDAYRYEIGITESKSIIKPTIPVFVPFTITDNFQFPWFSLSSDDVGYQRERNARIHLTIFAAAALSLSVGPLGRSAHYLPADRAGVMHAHHVAVRGLIAGASRVALRPEPPVPALSGVLGDFLEQLIVLGSGPVSHGSPDHDGLARLLEVGLIKGSVRVEGSEIGYPSFAYQPAGWQRDLPLMNASSMVSELAPVVLYLRHVVRPGDTLIIEEPESHLHPAMQVEFTRLLAAAVKAGIRIIITTHSEWVLEELANLVLLSELPDDHREGIEGADLALSPSEVGAWFFGPSEDDGGGTVVKEIPLDKEMGNFPSGFGLITTELYNRYANISNRIERLKEA